MASTQASEAQFAANVYNLISLQTEKFGKEYVKDLKEVDRLGITLPKLNFPSNFKFSIDNVEETSQGPLINITLKSIKLPYKFQTLLKSSASNTIYKLKEDLISSNNDFISFEPKNFKFLIKGKVLNDSTFLRDLTTEDIVITVFVSAPTSPPQQTPDQERNEDNEPENVVPEKALSSNVDLKLDEDTWSQFKTVLLNKYSDSDAETILERLKKGWDL